MHSLYSSPTIIRMMKYEMSGACGARREIRNANNILVGNSECKRPLGRPRPRREENIKMLLKEIAWESVDWISMVSDRYR